MLGSLGKAVFVREFFADQMIHARIGFPVGQCLFASFAFSVSVGAEMGDDATIGPGLGMMWVHGEHLGKLRLSLVVGFAIN